MSAQGTKWVDGRAMSMPEQREPIHAVLCDGRQVALRPARPEDGAAPPALPSFG